MTTNMAQKLRLIVGWLVVLELLSGSTWGIVAWYDRDHQNGMVLLAILWCTVMWPCAAWWMACTTQKWWSERKERPTKLPKARVHR
jgi:hypothetical protein